MSSSHGKLKSPRSLIFHQDTPKVGTHSLDERMKVAGIRFELKKKKYAYYVAAHCLFRSTFAYLDGVTYRGQKVSLRVLWFSPLLKNYPVYSRLFPSPIFRGGDGSTQATQKQSEHYYHYTWPNDRLPSLKRSFSRAKRQSAGCKWNLQPAAWFYVKQSLPYEINLYDLALCIANNNYHMTFVGR